MTDESFTGMAPDTPADTASPEQNAANPIVVEVVRGDIVESRHRGAFAIVDTEGRVVRSAGDYERAVYPRSAIKPLQALALAESGGIEAYELGDAEVAVACASHSGEPRHAETVRAWLERLGLGVQDLECGAHLPYDERAAAQLLRKGERPSGLHNNCSGKHTGFLTVAKQIGAPTRGYIDYAHPVQQRILGILESMTGMDLGGAPWGVDGCGIPTIAIPLGNLALAMARLGNPDDQPETRQAAAARIREAMAAEPFMVGGTDSFCTEVMEALQGRALVKTGAEAVYCGTVPELGLGIALKIDDGAVRASEVLMGGLLRLVGAIDAETAAGALAQKLNPPVHNRVGRIVGEIRLAGGILD